MWIPKCEPTRTPAGRRTRVPDPSSLPAIHIVLHLSTVQPTVQHTPTDRPDPDTDSRTKEWWFDSSTTRQRSETALPLSVNMHNALMHFTYKKIGIAVSRICPATTLPLYRQARARPRYLSPLATILSLSHLCPCPGRQTGRQADRQTGRPDYGRSKHRIVYCTMDPIAHLHRPSSIVHRRLLVSWSRGRLTCL